MTCHLSWLTGTVIAARVAIPGQVVEMLAQEGAGVCKQWSSLLLDGEERVAIRHEGNGSEIHPWIGIAPAVAKGDIKVRHMQSCHQDFFSYEIRLLAVAAMYSNLNYTSKG